jgi:hypothetical protein
MILYVRTLNSPKALKQRVPLRSVGQGQTVPNVMIRWLTTKASLKSNLNIVGLAQGSQPRMLTNSIDPHDLKSVRMTLKAILQRIDDSLEKGDASSALDQCDVLLGAHPHNVAAWTRRGASLLLLDRPREARRAFNKALNEDPASGAAWNGLGKAFFDLDDLSASANAFGHAASIFDSFPASKEAANEFASARYHQSMAQLAGGDFATGWPTHEARLSVTRMGFSDQIPPRWAGQPIAGRRLLVLFEQGFGDMIQFARYLPRFGALGCDLVISAPADLIPLLSPMVPDATIISREDGQVNAKSADFAVWLMSLPHLFGTKSTADIPNDIPYIEAPKPATRDFARPDATELSVGLVWAGRPTHPQDHQRTIDSALLAPLLDLPDFRFHALQKEGDAHPVIASRFARDRRDELISFSVTASILAQLDLIITVDTAVAHLAGAMGRPVWVMLPFAADWRWLRGRNDSPWYPTMRLFRQTQAGDWATVISALGNALRDMRGDP